MNDKAVYLSIVLYLLKKVNRSKERIYQLAPILGDIKSKRGASPSHHARRKAYIRK